MRAGSSVPDVLQEPNFGSRDLGHDVVESAVSLEGDDDDHSSGHPAVLHSSSIAEQADLAAEFNSFQSVKPTSECNQPGLAE